MKYFTISEDGEHCVGDVPDDTVILEVGATFGPNGQRLPPIEYINLRDGRYKRLGCEEEQIPPSAVQRKHLNLRRLTEHEVAEFCSAAGISLADDAAMRETVRLMFRKKNVQERTPGSP